jgi:iron(III) transport system substrate-binding protein
MSLSLRASLPLLVAAMLVTACGRQPATDESTPAASGIVNVYSGRHYDSDRAVFRAFQKKTGIEVRSIEADGAQLLERLKAEGEYTNADVIMTVDAGNLTRLVDAGLLAPTTSPTLVAVPAQFRDTEGRWYAFARRARVIAYRKGALDPAMIASMDDLTKPALRGGLCVRTSTNLYNISLLAARIVRDGPDKARAWARGIVANFAREPQGSDTDQIRAVAAGDCKATIVNHYYLARMRASGDPADKAVADKIGVVFPDQAGAGTHVNISGAGVSVHARNKANAVRLLEFMVSPEAQTIIAELNDEYPVAEGVTLPPALAELGDFKAESVPFAEFGARQGEATRIFEEVGWR